VTIPTKIGRYEIIERVGRGGMGAVYRGRDSVLDREVAIKVMSADFAADETSRPRFYREARSAAKLQHRNIVTIFEFGEEDETPFIVMEFLRGQDLSKRMRAMPPLTLEQKIDVIAELCTGLHFAHEQGVIHRDVKPANIWLVPDGSVKLLDFGIAKSSTSTMTRQGSVFGSISYMSPEQVNGSNVDGRADIFAAGVVLYELLSGKKPFAGESTTAVLARIMDDEPASAADLPADLPKRLVAAVLKALNKDRDERYRHAADFGADLRLVRSALAAGAEAPVAEVDLAETKLTDTGSNKLADSGPHRPADQVTVARTADLVVPVAAPRPAPSRKWLAAVLGGVLVLAAATLLAVLWRERAAAPDVKIVPKQATVRIASDPAGAAISIDGQPLGKPTPAEITVDSGHLPVVRISRPGSKPVEGRLTADDVALGRWSRALEPESPHPQPPPAPTVPSVVPPEVKTDVTLSGEYPFEVTDDRGAVLSPSASTHHLKVSGRNTLHLRNGEFLLDHPVGVDGSGRPLTAEAPELGRLQIRSRLETCSLAIGTKSLGEPPYEDLQLAPGRYSLKAVCPDGSEPQAVPVTVRSGQLTKAEIK
jgi:serine/threonine-protein kinase